MAHGFSLFYVLLLSIPQPLNMEQDGLLCSSTSINIRNACRVQETQGAQEMELAPKGITTSAQSWPPVPRRQAAHPSQAPELGRLSEFKQGLGPRGERLP